MRRRLHVEVNARAQVSARDWKRRKRKGTHVRTRSTERWNQFWRCCCFLRGTRSFGNASRRAAPRQAVADIEIGRNVGCLLLFMQEAAYRSALKTARSEFHGFFTNNSTCNWHINQNAAFFREAIFNSVILYDLYIYIYVNQHNFMKLISQLHWYNIELYFYSDALLFMTVVYWWIFIQ